VRVIHCGHWPITHDLAGLRQHIRHHAQRLGLTGQRLDDLLIAANEAAINVLEHGGGSGVLALWHDEAALTVDVTDSAGRLAGGDVERELPASASPATRGFGLWLMGRLCDEFAIHQETGRSRVRLRMRLHAPGALNHHGA
jgi:anti-sigma regulatory factor (Ser/Thr protein kinase)